MKDRGGMVSVFEIKTDDELAAQCRPELSGAQFRIPARLGSWQSLVQFPAQNNASLTHID